ncbi:unnamed protein product [Oppiella nova]|uniref:Uncharacterized protein n=1 Tax=Oppiella nova TaxID=334625 RepID=A0A7R9LY41_9ACAR|nr:unnamed protein product [Oppiella nova]CAG2168070.1 unnamed protein product [Oppiella nova]
MDWGPFTCVYLISCFASKEPLDYYDYPNCPQHCTCYSALEAGYKPSRSYSVVCGEGVAASNEYKILQMADTLLNTVYVEHLTLQLEFRDRSFKGNSIKNLVLNGCDFLYVMSGEKDERVTIFDGIDALYLEWSNLWYLDLRDNQLQAFPSELVDALPAIKVLKLGQNKIRTIDSNIINTLLVKCREFSFDKIPEPGDTSSVSKDDYFEARPDMCWSRSFFDTPQDIPYFFYESLKQVKCKTDKTSKVKDFAEHQWFVRNIPFIEIPDKHIEDVYYYRWSSLKRHLRYTITGTGNYCQL